MLGLVIFDKGASRLMDEVAGELRRRSSRISTGIPLQHLPDSFEVIASFCCAFKKRPVAPVTEPLDALTSELDAILRSGGLELDLVVKACHPAMMARRAFRIRVDSHEHQHLVAHLLHREGWSVEVTPRHDKGLDVIAERGEVRLEVQAKM